MVDPLKFNIYDGQGLLLCPACGFPEFSLDPVYDPRGGIIGTTICPCCLWEPGFDDEPNASSFAKATILDSLRAYRKNWGEKVVWNGRAANIPDGWDGKSQLLRLFEIAPQVR